MVEWGGRWCTQNNCSHTAIDSSSMRLSGRSGHAERRQSQLQSVDHYAISAISEPIENL